MTEGQAPVAIGQLEAAPSPAARWLAAVLCILYGFAKINGSQFTVLESELTKPLADVDGFWLTWHYFGYSAVYGTLLALLQIGGGVLLIVPRTALAGAVLLLPGATNIVLIDIFYGVDLGGTVAAIVLLTCVVVTMAPYARRLSDAVLLKTQPLRPAGTTLLALAVVVAGSSGFTWWVANHNNRVPTAIDGVWAVTTQAQAAAGTPQWQLVFFERNRAHLVVFRSDAEPDARHHFEIDGDGNVRIWAHWLRKDVLIMQGRASNATQIDLELTEPSGGRLVLTRLRGAH